MQNQQGPAPDEYKVLNRNQAEAAMAIIAALTIQLDDQVNQQNAKILLAREHDVRIAELKGRMERYAAALEDWAQKDRRRWEGKCLDLAQGRIGFRLVKPSVQFLEGWDEGRTLAKLRATERLGVYIRTKESLNKVLVCQDAAPEVGRLDAKDLKAMGLRVAQGETFYVEPALDVVP